MEFELRRYDARHLGLDLYQSIYAAGSIESGDTRRLALLLDQWQVIPGGTVVFDSPGGSLREGLALGRLIRERELHTDIRRMSADDGQVDGPAQCASAAAWAYLGGVFRHIHPDSTFGIHRFYSPDSRVDADVAQVLSGELVEYLGTMGIDPDVFRLSTIAGRDEILIPNHEDLERLRIVTGNVLNVTWEYRNVEGFSYLAGEQRDNRGLNKLLFLCGNGNLGIHGYLDSPDPQMVVSSTPYRGWMIDGKFYEFAPGEMIGEPMVSNQYVIIATNVSEERLEQILAANKVGMALQPENRDFYSGFQLDVTGGYDRIRSFARGRNIQWNLPDLGPSD